MAKPIVLVSAPKLIGDAEKILLGGGVDITYMQYPVNEDSLIAQFERQPVDGLLMSGPPPLTRRVLSAAKHLKVISKTGAGYDSVDMDAANELGIAMIVSKGANADAVAEHTLAMMLSLARELPRFDRDLRKGIWKDPSGDGRGFRGQTVGIVGFGAIGRKVAKLCAAFGAHVVLHSRSRIADLPASMEEETDFERLLGRVDILSLHCPLNKDTRGLIGQRQIALMKPTAFVINTSRGNVIDEAALIAALESGQLAGAGLDTFATEPPLTDNPLLRLPNVIVTPHIAAQTEHANNNMGDMAAKNLLSYLRGEIYDEPSVMNPNVLQQSARRPRVEPARTT
jgi:D-3-phosphoglycerate dehydrogenase